MSDTNELFIPLSANGEMRDFGNGCHRDDATGKGRCDWLYLHAVAKIMNDRFIEHVALFMDDLNPVHLNDALKELPGHIQEYTSIPQMMLEVSKLYEAGAVKYGANNWQRGMPLWCYIDSGLRHYFKTIRGDDDEPHYRGVVWNMLCAMWTITNIPESTNDLKKDWTTRAREFPIGAGRCDLLPLAQVACLIDNDDVLVNLAAFIKTHDVKAVYDAINALINDMGRADMMISLSKICEIQGKDEKFGPKGWINMTLTETLNQAIKCYFSELDNGNDHIETLWWLLNVVELANIKTDELAQLGHKE